MSTTTENPLDLYHDALGLETHDVHDDSFIVRAGVTPYPQEMLDTFVVHIKSKAPPRALPRTVSRQLYEPITNPFEIRVLEIKPGIGTEKIKAALHHCTVEFDHKVFDLGPKWAISSTDYTKPVFFTALSYT
ncbi:heterokaryon incompatibility [Fusarium longipes]|uniref:Heterokaryon incompatibility n=1 Tax=Fusarium longipes TaxID=694270 RepID=A0A395SH56_9HYPO|nr:heterokaryon incompatibility [Fusarium longipes]